MANFLVTGGAGFIGSHLVRKLLALGHRVRVLDDLSSGRLQNLQEVEGRFEWLQADAADSIKAREAMRGVHGVFHLAATPSVNLSIEDSFQNQHSGEVATLAILDAARRSGVRRVVFSSSAAVYGDVGDNPISEDTETRPITPYAVSKRTSEDYCRVFSNLNPELETVALRYFNVFGLRQSPLSSNCGVVTIFMRCLRERIQPTIFGDGHQTRDFVEVANVVAANIAAMESPKFFRGECFNVGSGTSVAIVDLWYHLKEIAQSDLTPQFQHVRVGEIKHSRADISKIARILDFRPDIGWKEGLTRLWKSGAI